MLQKQKRLIVFRSATPAAPNIPLRVRSAGCYDVSQDWEEGPRQKWFAEIFWGVTGCGEFQNEHGWERLEAGWLYFYRPGEIHRLRALTNKWRYCWVTFDHPEATHWLESFGLGERIHHAGPCPEAMFLEITEALRSCTVEGESRAANLAHALLSQASTAVQTAKPGSLAARAKACMDHDFTNPAFTVNELAEAMKVHRSTLFRHFSASYGLKPSSYLHKLRLQHGLTLLRNNTEYIQDISHAAGFSDPNYFARSVREATGMSPSEFRRH